MAQSKKGKKAMNMVYGLGAAVVILGALFKIQHWPFADAMLITGLIVEALVFAISAFEPVDNELDWSKVYPQLAEETTPAKGKKGADAPKDEQGLLSKKLDDMLKEAKIDSALMQSLGESIKNFEGAAKSMAPTAEAMDSQKKYSEEMSLAAQQMESLNTLYKVQVEAASKQAEANADVANNVALLKEQMESLTKNLNSLNGVYGGMLSAMSVKA
jgi:gliding motility-associated protein GldL